MLDQLRNIAIIFVELCFVGLVIRLFTVKRGEGVVVSLPANSTSTADRGIDANEDRVAREQESYDEGSVWQNSNKLQRRFWHVFECPNTQYGEIFYKDFVASVIPNAVVLDYGCYDGSMSGHYLSFKPQRLVGIDISKRAIERAKERYDDKAEFYVMDAHKLEFPDNSFDVVVGVSILHHLDFETAITEVQRVLKPGGYAIFQEPLRDNPGGKLVRALTPKARTADELPLSRKQIKWADNYIGGQKHVFTGLFSTALGMATSLVLKKPDNWILVAADKLDRKLMHTPMRYWMRRAYLVWHK